MQMTAVPIRAIDAAGIRREMAEVMREGYAIVLMPEQARALDEDARRQAQDATLDPEVM